MSWLILAAFIPITLLAYQPVWHGAFLWDDDGHVTKEGLRSVSSLWRIWFEPGATQQYYPVVHTAFWLQRRLWDLNTTGYHVVSIVLHAISAGLFVTILRRLDVRLPAALLAGAIFALHPVHVESVAWISELKNTLSGVFYLVAALLYLQFDERRDGRRAAGWYWGALGAFVLALLSKSVTATLPAGLLVVFWWRRGRLEWRRDVRPLLPFFATGVAAGAMTIWMERTFIGAEGAQFDFTLIERVLIAGRATCFYLASLVWPANLAFSYERWAVSQTFWWQYLFPVAVLLAMAALWRIRHQTRAPLAALLYFGVTLGPALGFVNVYPFAYAFVADHFQYLASLGIIALAAGAAMAMADRWGSRVPRASLWVAIAVVLPLALVTWRDAHAWVGKEVLYRTTIARSPDAWLAHNNLAAMLLEGQTPDVTEALARAKDAVRLAPDRAATHFNLGLAYEAAGDHTAAADAYRTAIERATPAEHTGTRVALARESLARAEVNSGISLLRSGRPDEAALRLARVLAQFPQSVEGRFALGLAFEQRRQFQEAAAEFSRVVALAPSHVEAHRHLGRALHTLGRREEAVPAYRAALAIDPDSADTHNDLGVALAELGRFREAEPHFAEALRLNPGDAQAQNNLVRTRQQIARGGRGRGGG